MKNENMKNKKANSI